MKLNIFHLFFIFLKIYLLLFIVIILLTIIYISIIKKKIISILFKIKIYIIENYYILSF